jgi:translation elongation factor EF-G
MVDRRVLSPWVGPTSVRKQFSKRIATARSWVIFVNKMDRTGADFYKVHSQVKDRLQAPATNLCAADRCRRRL